MLAQFLEAGNYPFMVPVTGAGPTCSLLGNALERGYGVTPHTNHFSAFTDLEAVLPDGTLYRTALSEAGGEDLARLFKWGIGPHSAGLFTQSGFGVVTRMSIVLARRPEVIIGRRTKLHQCRRLRTGPCGSCASARCRRARSWLTGTSG